MLRSLLFIFSFYFLPLCIYSQVKKHSPSVSLAKNISESIERGKVVYTANCLTCHQANGTGVPRMNPPLVKNKYILGSKTFLIRQALKGSKNTIDIDGDKFTNAMPPFERLTDEQIADVLTYVRNSFSNKASGVKASEVALIRKGMK